MPTIYLSPSTQEYNEYITGGTEEQWMNLLADHMAPYLVSTGIFYSRNTPDMTAASSIRASNAGNYDFHFALHSNAAPPNLSGLLRGPQAYYYPRSTRGQRAATIIANNLMEIYPLPELVQTIPTTSLGEVVQTRAPSVLLEVAYHDNLEDALWITENLDLIARNLVESLADYFAIPFREPPAPIAGRVTLRSGYLNIRNSPSLNGHIIGRAYNGDPVTILGSIGDWYLVNHAGTLGFANRAYITV